MANAQMDHLYYRMMQPAQRCAVNSFFHFFFQEISCGTECLSSEEAHLVDKKGMNQDHEARERPFINKPESKAKSVSGKHQ